MTSYDGAKYVRCESMKRVQSRFNILNLFARRIGPYFEIFQNSAAGEIFLGPEIEKYQKFQKNINFFKISKIAPQAKKNWVQNIKIFKIFKNSKFSKIAPQAKFFWDPK